MQETLEQPGKDNQRSSGAGTMSAASELDTADEPSGSNSPHSKQDCAANPLSGLTHAEVAARRSAGQVNAAPTRSSRTMGEILFSNIVTPFNGLLVALACIIIIVAHSPINAAFGFVVVVNSCIGIFQEVRAKRTLDKLAILSAPTARVIREGATEEIAVDEVVLDDVLNLRLGDQVVADGEFLATSEIEIDESLLTGESDPIVKNVGDTVLSGSIVVAGSGVIRVNAVGSDAYSAKITSQAKRFQRTPSELVQSTNKLLKWISWMLIIVAPLLVWGQVRIDGLEAWTPAFVHACAAIVGMIPEGLVLLTSMAFMLAAMVLARRKILVQQMPAVEGLARVDTLLLDKTGTLTEGVIQFDSLVVVEERSATGKRELPAAEHELLLKRVLKTMSERVASPTNDALNKGLANVEPLPFMRETPFSSARKWSSLTVDEGNFILGAPEVLFASNDTSTASEQARALAQSGKRVLTLMASPEEPNAEYLPANLRPLALVVLSEKVRDDAQETLGFFAGQGVDIKIISGDSPLTVAAIAREVGLVVEQPFDARSLPEGDEECLGVILSHNVFGRVQPEQKRRIAKLLQSKGRTVAMTGDGVNDALALKDADLGIAMNSGASATKAVAELVLMDNRFSSLPRALAEGRRVIANIERVANLFIIKNVYSLVLSLAVTVAGQTYPFVPVQMTVLSALTIGVPAFFLALAPNQQLYRPGFLGRVLRFAIPVGIIAAVAMMVGYMVLGMLGIPVLATRTAVSIITMAIGCWVLVCLARPLKGWKIGLIVVVTAAFVALLCISFTANVLEYQIDLAALPVVGLISLVAGALVELTWRLMQRTKEQHPAAARE